MYRWLGDAFHREDLPEQAWGAYSKAIAQAPADEDNYLTLAAFCIERRNAALARETLARGLAQLPGSAKLTLETGLVWALEGNFDQARKAFLQSSALDPKWSLPLLALGVTDLQTGNSECGSMFSGKQSRLLPMIIAAIIFTRWRSIDRPAASQPHPARRLYKNCRGQ